MCCRPRRPTGRADATDTRITSGIARMASAMSRKSRLPSCADCPARLKSTVATITRSVSTPWLTSAAFRRLLAKTDVVTINTTVRTTWRAISRSRRCRRPARGASWRFREYERVPGRRCSNGTTRHVAVDSTATKLVAARTLTFRSPAPRYCSSRRCMMAGNSDATGRSGTGATIASATTNVSR